MARSKSKKVGEEKVKAPPEENTDVWTEPQLNEENIDAGTELQQDEENVDAVSAPKPEKTRKARHKNKPKKENWDDGTKPKPLNAEHAKMLEWLKKVKFRHSIVGGLDEADVWRRLEELNSLYEAALIAERARYDLQLEEFERALREKDLEMDELAQEASEKLEKYRSALKTAKVEYEKLAAWVRQRQDGEGLSDE